MKGKVWKFGNDIDTDIILPGRYLIYTDEERLSEHCMEGLVPDFKNKANEGDFILGGTNFGCGSSREHAPIAIKGCGISAVIAESFARIFYRNATNVGVPLLEAPGVSGAIEDGEEIEVDMEKGLIISESGKEIEFKKLPPFMLEILESGGLISIYSMTAEVFMGLIIPIPFLPKFMINIGKFLPFRFMSDFPYRVYSGDISVIEGRGLLLGSIIWLIVSITLGYLVSKLALKKAVIQGG